MATVQTSCSQSNFSLSESGSLAGELLTAGLYVAYTNALEGVCGIFPGTLRFWAWLQHAGASYFLFAASPGSLVACTLSNTSIN